MKDEYLKLPTEANLETLSKFIKDKCILLTDVDKEITIDGLSNVLKYNLNIRTETITYILTVSGANAPVMPFLIIEDDSINESEQFLEGSVKWDGCCNFTYGVDETYLHICSVKGALIYSELLFVCYKLAELTMESFQDNIDEELINV